MADVGSPAEQPVVRVLNGLRHGLLESRHSLR
jgi:hypothetical protein